MSDGAKWLNIQMRIIISGDVFRIHPEIPHVSNSLANIEWLYYLLKWQLEQATSLPVEIAAWKPGSFDYDAFLELSHDDMSTTHEAWLKFYNTSLTTEMEDYILQFYADAIVITFEINPTMSALFRRHGIPHINLTIHPIRFLDDLMFGFQTNNVEIGNRIRNFEADLSNIDFTVNLITAKLRQKGKLDIPQNTTVITGQKYCDRSLISNGRFLTFNDYEETLMDLIETETSILFKPHVNSTNDCPLLKDMEQLGIQVVIDNFYQLLAQDNLKKIVTINSSTGVEAKFFGKETVFLSNKIKTEIPIMKHHFNPGFWADILSPIIETKMKNCPFDQTLKLRKFINNAWAYKIISD